jgi:hypothetical protein
VNKKQIVMALEALSMSGVSDQEAAVIAAASGEVAASEKTAVMVRAMIEPNLPDSPEAAAQVAALQVRVLTLPDGTKTSEAKGKKEPKDSLAHKRALIHDRIRKAFDRAKAAMEEGDKGANAGHKVRAVPKDPEQACVLADANIAYLNKVEKSKFPDVARQLAAWKAYKAAQKA